MDLNYRPRPYHGLLWCYMHSSVEMIILLTTSLMVTYGMIVGSRLPVPSRVENQVLLVKQSFPTAIQVASLQADFSLRCQRSS